MSPRQKRNSISHPQASRSRSANPFNHCHNLSAVAGHRATILQPHSTADEGQAMTAGVPSVAATTHQRLRELHQSSRSLHQSSPEPHQPLRGFIQPFLHVSQSLPEAYQSLKEAHQPLQEAQNKQFGINPPKVGVLHPILVSTCHLTSALSPSGEGEALPASFANPRRDRPGEHRQSNKHPTAVPSPVGRERVRVWAIAFSNSQLTTMN